MQLLLRWLHERRWTLDDDCDGVGALMVREIAILVRLWWVVG
jgi:hypothetical protein